LAAAQRMRAIVEGLLKLARADAGHAQIARETVSLSSIVQDVANMLRPLADQHQVTLATDLPTADTTMVGDPSLLGELVTNLLTNAIRYNRPTGQVTARLTDADNDHLQFTITDTGIGISAADQPHVFDRFYRADQSRQQHHTETSGTGLGLAIAKWITTAHGGTISLSSTEGKGTTITVTLPRSSPSPVLGRGSG
jgi:signal transduction histidine kinase